MPQLDKFKLIAGPYLPPKAWRGDRLFCEIRGTVVVGGWHDGPIPWPRMKKGGRACLIVTETLARAVRAESAVAVAHHFGVCPHTVAKWRQALGVEEINPGTHVLTSTIARARTDDRMQRAQANSLLPASVEKRAAQRRGKPPHPNALKAPRDTHPPGWAQKIAETMRERGNWLRPDTRFWTAEEDALLGTVSDAEAAKTLGRTVSAVYTRRHILKRPGELVQVDPVKLRRARERAGLTQCQLDAAGGVFVGKVRAIEGGREKSLRRPALEKMAAALGVSVAEIACTI